MKTEVDKKKKRKGEMSEAMNRWEIKEMESMMYAGSRRNENRKVKMYSGNECNSLVQGGTNQSSSHEGKDIKPPIPLGIAA